MMISLELLQIAEENFLITFSIVFGIGLLQGAILARGIRRKFPKLKKYAKGISIILLILTIGSLEKTELNQIKFQS